MAGGKGNFVPGLSSPAIPSVGFMSPPEGL